MHQLDLKARVESWHNLDIPTAAITIDIEPDFGAIFREGLKRIPDLLRAAAKLGVPVTAFIEGKLLEEDAGTVEALLEAGVDLQLHCYDHLKGGDDLADLKRGVNAYEHLAGKRPEGYRANTFRLSEPLYRALRIEGFAWDSSILPGFALGGNRSAARRGDYCVLDGGVVEFPVATWGPLPLPLIQSYRKIIKSPAERLLRKVCPLPRLLVYDMHMTDLVWTGTLSRTPMPPLLKAGHYLMWGWRRGDYFDDLTRFVRFLQVKGYRFISLSQLYSEVAGKVVDERRRAHPDTPSLVRRPSRAQKIVEG